LTLLVAFELLLCKKKLPVACALRGAMLGLGVFWCLKTDVLLWYNEKAIKAVLLSDLKA
jgi:hypothetical protein